ncbi:hypothetical protein PI125_g9583 [Phytophthora idaei]|nr:hypothetical protein PI125_g9583 [Phytophthora idaei]
MSCNQGRRVLPPTILQYSAVAVGQRGPITQIPSGCADAQREEVMREPTLYYDFRSHSLCATFYGTHKHDIIALIDGDIIFVKPLEVNTTRDVTKYYHGKRDLSTVNDTVADAIAIAQDWYNYLNTGWSVEHFRAKLEAICTGKPCMNVTRDDAREYYSSTSPPYIMTRHDMEEMVDDYCDFVVQGSRVHDAWMVEMIAYSQPRDQTHTVDESRSDTSQTRIGSAGILGIRRRNIAKPIRRLQRGRDAA